MLAGMALAGCARTTEEILPNGDVIVRTADTPRVGSP